MSFLNTPDTTATPTTTVQRGQAEPGQSFTRLPISMYFRPARRRFTRLKSVNGGLGGVRVYSDEPLSVGTRVEVDLFLPEGRSADCLAEVKWVESLSEHEPAAFDVGLHLVRVPQPAYASLASLFDREQLPQDRPSVR